MAKNQNNNLNIEELRREYEEFKMLGVDEKTLKKIEDAINQLEKKEEEKKKKDKEAKKKAADVAKKLKEDKKNEEKQSKKIVDSIKKIVKKQEKEEKESLDIDDRVLEILGLEDYELDLDGEQLNRFIKEYLVTARMVDGKGEEKEGDNELLKATRKKVAGKKGKVNSKSRKKTVTASGFKGRTQTRPTSDTPKKVQTNKLLPSAGQTGGSMRGQDIDGRIEEAKAEIEENTQEKLLPLSQSLDDIAKALEGILNTNQKKLEIEKQAARDAAKKEETAGFKEKEAELEEKDDGKKVTEGIEKTLSPTTSIFDMILGFFKNILLGGAITGLLEIFKDPAKFLTDLEDALNGFINFANGIIQSVSNFIFAPYNAVITSINQAINELEYALKQIAKVIPGVPTPKFPNIPLLQLPNLPTIKPGTLHNLFNVQQQAGGGEVMGDGMSFLEGGAIDNLSGMRIKGMGKDTQLIAAQPGEVMMSKKAVEMFGADTLLGMNAAAGGTNKPKYGKVPGFSGGGQVGRVIIGAGHAPTPQNAARGIELGSDGRPVVGTADDGSDGRNTPGTATGVKEWQATKHVVDTLKRLVQERGLTDKIGFRDIYSWDTLSSVPREVESTPGQQYVDLHFDARGYGRAGVLPSANESATDRSLMNVFGRHSAGFDPSSKAVTSGGGTLLELASIDDPAIRSLLMEVKRGEQGPASMQMAEKILGGILPSLGASDALSGAPPPPVLPPPPGAQVGPTNITMNNISPPVMSGGGGGTQVLPVPQSTGQLNSAASAAQGRIPNFGAEDGGNFDLIVVKSIYNIVG